MSSRTVGPFSVAPIGLGCMNLSHAYKVRAQGSLEVDTDSY